VSLLCLFGFTAVAEAEACAAMASSTAFPLLTALFKLGRTKTGAGITQINDAF